MEETPQIENLDEDSESFGSKSEFDAMWVSARKAAGVPGKTDRPVPPREYFIHPVLTLYTGLFLGPIFAALVAMFTVRGRVKLRIAAMLIGAAGASWLLIQGLTSVYTDTWTAFSLQFLRSGINFVCGAVCFSVVHFSARDTYGVRRMTWHRTFGAVIVLASAYWVLKNYLFVIGR